MPVTTSKRWNNLRDMNPDDAMGQLAGFVLLRYLDRYVPRDFADAPWRIGLTEASAKAKVKQGGLGVDDLFMTGRLYTEIAINAAKAMTIEGATAFTFLSASRVPYCGAHQYGYAPNKLPQRRYIRLIEHKDYLVADLQKQFVGLMIGEKS